MQTMNNQYAMYSNERTFEVMTDEMIISVVGYDVNFQVETIADGIKIVRSLAKNGIMARVKVEKLFYVKGVYALSRDNQYILGYVAIWKEVPVH